MKKGPPALCAAGLLDVFFLLFQRPAPERLAVKRKKENPAKKVGHEITGRTGGFMMSWLVMGAVSGGLYADPNRLYELQVQ